MEVIKMFEKVFEEAIELGVATKTKAIYFVDNQGDYIYKIKKGYKRVLKQKLKEVGFEIIRDTKDKVDVIFFNNIFIGCIE